MPRQHHEHWTPEQDAALVEGFQKRMNDQQIKDVYNLPFTVNAIRCKRARMRLVSRHHSEYMKESCAQRRQERAARCLQSASIWHLVDLKRAGHSPTKTELSISNEGLPTRFHIEPCLLSRSPAAALVEG
jgi:hypothetical protein